MTELVECVQNGTQFCGWPMPNIDADIRNTMKDVNPRCLYYILAQMKDHDMFINNNYYLYLRSSIHSYLRQHCPDLEFKYQRNDTIDRIAAGIKEFPGDAVAASEKKRARIEQEIAYSETYDCESTESEIDIDIDSNSGEEEEQEELPFENITDEPPILEKLSSSNILTGTRSRNPATPDGNGDQQQAAPEQPGDADGNPASHEPGGGNGNPAPEEPDHEAMPVNLAAAEACRRYQRFFYTEGFQLGKTEEPPRNAVVGL